MQLILIDEQGLHRCTLPEKVSGRYWIHRAKEDGTVVASVRHVGPGNSSRTTSTELATKGFVGSWNYETGNR